MKNLNLDLSEKLKIDSNTEKWILSEDSSFEYIPLEFENGDNGRKTSLIKLKKGAKLLGLSSTSSKEIIILSGQLTDGKNSLSDRAYIRMPAKSRLVLEAVEDTKVFIKENTNDPKSNETVFINTKSQEWLQGHGNLKVMPLHSAEEGNAALVLWPEGERFVPHRHWGGEEIFVLSGEFIDEHSRYPAGTWLRSPHQSSHFPFVEKETIILVKVGHLHPETT